MTAINFDAPPTVARFMKSQSFGRLIAGPVGSGKTTGCVFELLRRACEQERAPDGFRYTRFAIVRQTLKQLKDTVLKDILAWLGKISHYKVMDQTVFVEVGDVRSEWMLIPLDDPDSKKRLLSMQLTGAWMSEAIEMDVGFVNDITGRCGRYPSALQGGATWFGVIADTNMPSEGSPWHKFMTDGCPSGWTIYVQPGGMEENAENLEWLTQTSYTSKLPVTDPRRRAQGRTYYERLVEDNSESWCKRYVHAKFGDDPSGTAVFADSFKSDFHVVDELGPVIGHTLLIGQDFGRDPWSIICQLDHKGRLLVLEEVAAQDTGLEQHVTQSLRPRLMDPLYLGKSIAIIGDPAGTSKGSIFEETSFDALKRLGFMAFPAPTNAIDARLRAIEAFLLQQRDGGAAILIDRSRCPTIVRAMGGGYKFGKLKSGQRKATPEKNEFSHPIDALQYACLAAHGGMVTGHINNRLRPRATRTKEKVSAAAWT